MIDRMNVQHQMEIMQYIKNFERQEDKETEKIIDMLKREFKETSNAKPGLTDKGLEIALQLYQISTEKLPPRRVASKDRDQLKMPIPFKNLASPTQLMPQSSASPIQSETQIKLHTDFSPSASMVSQKDVDQEYSQSELVNNDLVEETGSGMVNTLILNG